MQVLCKATCKISLGYAESASSLWFPMQSRYLHVLLLARLMIKTLLNPSAKIATNLERYMLSIMSLSAYFFAWPQASRRVEHREVMELLTHGGTLRCKRPATILPKPFCVFQHWGPFQVVPVRAIQKGSHFETDPQPLFAAAASIGCLTCALTRVRWISLSGDVERGYVGSPVF